MTSPLEPSMPKMKFWVKINGVIQEIDDGLIAFDNDGTFYDLENLLLNLNIHQIANARV